ncbi:MAG: vWA domain-containing protein [Candidatus Woesearchaeota archaeon]
MGLKGLFFTMDALISAFLIVGALLAASSFYIHEVQKGDTSFVAQDAVNMLSRLKVGETDNPYVQSLILQHNITDLNNSVLEQIGVFWAEGKTTLASGLVENLLLPLVPQGLSLAVLLDDDPVFMLNRSSPSSVSSFKKFISGIALYKPVKGFSARMFLRLDSRHTSSLAYFGGFVGQGNISKRLWLAGNISSIDEAYLELDPSDNFLLYINGQFVGAYIKGSGGGAYMKPDRWYIGSEHYSKMHSGYNDIELRFPGLGYVAGGLFRVTYDTGTRQDGETVYFGNNLASIRYWFPKINGVINLYDGFTVPGTLKSMEAHLSFKSSFPTYLTIGETTVLSANGSSLDQTLDLKNMSDYPYSLDFNALSNSTVPLRFASYNISTRSITGSSADVILITDLSGSMIWKIGSWDEQNGVIRTCSNPQVYSDPTSRRISVAKCIDINFTDIIMNPQGNREWLVDFEVSAHYFSSNPADLTKQNLINKINSYTNNPSGGTCLCCAINLAYNILNSFTTSNRSKFVVVLTDGIPTYCCGVAGSGSNRRCANGTSTSQQYIPSACTGGQEDCNNNDCNGPRNNAIWSTQRLYNQFKAKVYTIGMGPIVGCRAANLTLQRIAQVGNGTFNASQNATKLRDMFRGIASSINAQVNQSNQELVVTGNLTPSILYDGSYLELNFTPIVPMPGYGKIIMTVESSRFANTISSKKFYLPSSVTLVDLFATSYSADKWTDNVSIFDGSSWSKVYSPSDSFVDYSRLGDPFVVMIPQDKVNYDVNSTILVRTGKSPTNSTNGSAYNKLVYTVAISNTLGYGNVYLTAVGCNWSVRYEDGTNGTLVVPQSYNGTKHCRFSPANFSVNDARDNAVYNFLNYLDFNKDGLLEVKIGQDDVSFDAMVSPEVPSMWGPSVLEVRIWK